MFDLTSMSIADLRQLQTDIDRAIRNLNDRRKKEALSELQERARQLGFSLGELVADASSPKARAKGQSKTEAKYRNPEDANLTWTGRGRKPLWFIAAIDAGFSPADMEVSAN